MATEPDLSALLPPPPPPRPGAREDAIAMAMRRFDGERPPAREPAPPRRWRLTGRPQLGLLAAAALVAVIGLPLWLAGENRPPAREIAVTAPAQPAAAQPSADPAAEPLADVPAGRLPGIVAEPSGAAAAPVLPPAPLTEQRRRDMPAELPPPPAVFVAAPPPPPPPPAPAPMAEEAASGADEVVVTGSRVSGRAAKAQQRLERRVAARGDWNACTVDDPRQDLEACRKTVRSAAPGAAGQAGALVGNGLTRAWQDDNDGAITAFDRALAVSPKSAAAWLNRGLAHAKAGDDARALADLDQAVRYAPTDARGWFQRSLILRRLGKPARADADAARAAELDPRYEDLVE